MERDKLDQIKARIQKRQNRNVSKDEDAFFVNNTIIIVLIFIFSVCAIYAVCDMILKWAK